MDVFEHECECVDYVNMMVFVSLNILGINILLDKEWKTCLPPYRLSLHSWFIFYENACQFG